MSMANPIQDVSETALMVAIWRARESERPDPLYRDPFAFKLAGERGREIVDQLPRGRAALSYWMMAIRTRVVDDLIREAIANGVDTVVNLGAGLDTRPYRLDLPQQLRWIEVDYPKILDLKSARLSDEKPVCALQRISCDLSDTPSRQALLLEIAKSAPKALVLTEGVIPYLTDKEVGALAEELKGHSCFRYWIADYIAPFVRRYRLKHTTRLRMQNAAFRFDPKDYFGFFLAHGWRSKEVRWLMEAAAKLGRKPPLPMRGYWAVRSIFMSAERRAEMRHFVGYVLFEPVQASTSKQP